MTFPQMFLGTCLVWLATQCFGQIQTRLTIGPLGGITEPLPAMKAPAELKPLLPKGHVLRAVLHTNMSNEGETLFLYDNGDELFSQTHLHVLHGQRVFKLFDEPISAVAGIQAIPCGMDRQLVSFAYHEGFDQADTTFVIFAAENGSYRRIFQQRTDAGRIRILGDSPESFETWSAEWKFDRPEESCVWCPHRYRVRTYVRQGDRFRLRSQRITKKYLYPGDVAETPFVLMRPPQDPRTHLAAVRADDHESR